MICQDGKSKMPSDFPFRVQLFDLSYYFTSNDPCLACCKEADSERSSLCYDRKVDMENSQRTGRMSGAPNLGRILILGGS